MVRKLNNKDVQAVINIWLEASIKAHPFIEASFWRSKTEDMRKVYLPASSTYVYEDDQTGLVLGFISFVGHHIAALFVHPASQGCGIGKELIKMAKQQFSCLRLHVFSKNLGAVEFYRKQGFTALEEKEEENTKEPEMVMEYNGTQA